MPSTPRNSVGDVYGQLTVIAPSDRRTKSGNAYWCCRCSCGRERDVAGDKLSLNVARRKPTVKACEECSREHQIDAVCLKHDSEERERRKQAKHDQEQLVNMVPDRWLKLPLTNAHARD